MFYSERNNGIRPRIKEDICYPMWKGLVGIIQALETQNYFSEEYPLLCDDFGTPFGTDSEKLGDVIEAYFGLKWPLQTTLKKENYWENDQEFIPELHQIFDILEFLFKKCSEPSELDYHSYYRHHHLSFNKSKGQEKFLGEINTLFRVRGLIYEMNSYGQIEKVITDETKSLISNVLNKRTKDIELNQMILDACSKIKSYDLNNRYHALEKLWDAWERLKNSFHYDKKTSANIIVNKFSENESFKNLIEIEMRELTQIGNTYRIRHSEPNQATLTSHNQVDYLFHRCLAMIDLIIYRIEK